MDITIPDDVKHVLDKLGDAGFEAYVAGGAVRDILAGKTPHNYDISTSAMPYQISKIFTKTIDGGSRPGVVTVISGNVGYEITAFRSDGVFDDNKHPDDACFTDDVYEDCLRRDFTINSMMYNPDTGILDYFGGIEDINNRIIRSVGEPGQRFKEDALRMLRAVRFKAELDFTIEHETERAIKKYAVLIKKIRPERTLEELNKILLSEHPDYIRDLHRLGLLQHIIPQLECCFGEPQRNKYHIYDVGEHIIQTIKNTPCDLTLRWAAVLHDTGKPVCPSVDSNGIIHFYGHHRESRRIALDLLHKLRMDNDMIHDICVLVENHDYRVDANYTSVKRMMSKIGAEMFEKLMILQEADNMAKNPKYLSEKLKRISGCMSIYRSVIASNQPYRISDLQINAADLAKSGFRQGRELTETLRILLDEVIINPELNNRAYLLSRAASIRKGSR